MDSVPDIVRVLADVARAGVQATTCMILLLVAATSTVLGFLRLWG